jgi:hypothetical protein
MSLTRKCPKCKTPFTYKFKKSFDKAIRLNSLCKKCGHVGNTRQAMSEEHKQKISLHHKQNGSGKWMKGRSPSKEIRDKISKANKNRIVSDITRAKLSKSNTGKTLSVETRHKISLHQRNNPRVISEETRHKLRLKAYENMENGKQFKGDKWKPFYNPNACKYFDNLSIERGWNIQHAENGGEVKVSRFWLDGYDRELNIAFEYDEDHHFTLDNKLRESDTNRHESIIDKLNCKFYRFSVKDNLLIEITKS